MRTENELRDELAQLLDAPCERDRSKVIALVWVLNPTWDWDTAQEVAAKLLTAARQAKSAKIAAV